MKKGLAFLLLFFLAFWTTNVVGQNTTFPEFVQKLEKFATTRNYEKVHLHLDKPHYAIGDDIWFTAYTLEGITNKPTTISGILYVELINDQDSISKQIKLPINNGVSWGNISLPNTLKEGNYRIRAFTNFMRNDAQNFFFDKTLKIGKGWGNAVYVVAKNSAFSRGEKSSLVSTLQFTDAEGTPYSDCKVSYEIKINRKSVLRSKSNTNQNGEITIQAIENEQEIYRSGWIVATINLPKQKVTKSIPFKISDADIDVQFFPEGGSLVDNLPNKIAFKAINSSGLGENIAGKIIDNQQNEVLKFKSTHLGMGAITFTPKQGSTYTAQITSETGLKKNVQLPVASQKGYTISVDNTDSTKILVKIFSSKEMIKQGELSFVAHRKGIPYFSAKIPDTTQISKLHIKKDSLPSGVITLTLLSRNYTPILERILFIDNTKDELELGISKFNTNYKTRENVDFQITTKKGHKPSNSNLSVAVTNAVGDDVENETNIFTSMLINSELVGYIEKPNYYFLNKNKVTSANLDNLMLTQGWRKLDWKKINDSSTHIFTYLPERSLSVKGTVTRGGNPVESGKVSLFSTNLIIQSTDVPTDNYGSFSIDNLIFPDTAKFVLQARTSKSNKHVQINLAIPPTENVDPSQNTPNIEANVNDNLRKYLKISKPYFEEQIKKGFLKDAIMLKEVNIEHRKEDIQSKSLIGSAFRDNVFTAKEMENSYSVSQFLQGRVAGLLFGNGVPYLNNAKFSLGAGGGVNMLVVLDGMPMRTKEGFNVNLLDIGSIESIEIFKGAGSTVIYGTVDGVMVITTKRGVDQDKSSSTTPGLITFQSHGFYSTKQFYSPKYDVDNPDPKPDLRTTVYWNPNILTDQKGNATFNYYNTDVPGVYRVVIEGIDANGNLGRKVFTYQVN